MTLFTIGFTQKSAEQFFNALRDAGIRRLLDIRLKNASQLAGFAKKDDLRFFLKRLCDIDYEHRPLWAPTRDLLDDFKKKRITWDGYEHSFRAMMNQRHIETSVTPELLDRACLLCSEPTADRCHRRLAAEYLQNHFPGLTICHL